MSDYTTCNYVVATKRHGRTMSKFYAADNFDKVMGEFDKLVQSLDVMYYTAVYVFTKDNWNGMQDRPIKKHMFTCHFYGSNPLSER